MESGRERKGRGEGKVGVGGAREGGRTRFCVGGRGAGEGGRRAFECRGGETEFQDGMKGVAVHRVDGVVAQQQGTRQASKRKQATQARAQGKARNGKRAWQ